MKTNSQATKQKWAAAIAQAMQLSDTSEFQLILPVGKYDTEKYGIMEFTEEFCAQLAENWKDKVLGNRQPFVDVNHDHNESQGWITALEARPDGLFAKVEWTPPGKQKVSEKIFKYFSPDIAKIKDLEGVEHYPVLVGLALTNTPVMNNLPDIQLSDLTPPKKGFILSANDRGVAAGKKENPMPDFEKFLEMLQGMVGPESDGLTPEQKDQIIDILLEGEPDTNLSAEATAGKTPDEKIAMKKLSKRLAFGKKLCAKLGEKPTAEPPAKETAEPKPPDAGFQASHMQTPEMSLLLAEHNANKAELSAMRAERHSERKEKVLGLALSQGKIEKTRLGVWQAEYDKSPATVELLLSEIKPSPLFRSIGHANQDGALSLSDADSSGLKEVAAKLGFDATQTERFIETNGATVLPKA